ncbi:hypothetical protein [Yaniella halotolerans]|uniref:hypothetical protein n=1 Tax=Yaniella halotolerans TaxID=225453 RepID=UPI0003B59DE0|nr:hypothetical protein [Yaniella halotolerans]
MKKTLTLITVAATCMLVGCGSTDSESSTGSAPAEEATQPPELTGAWTQTNSESESDFMVAEITDDTISVDWELDSAEIPPALDDNGDGSMTAIYWVGSFTAPDDASDPYSWSSQRDAEATDTALLASTADSKDFTYEDGVLHFTVSIQGESSTVEMEQD